MSEFAVSVAPELKSEGIDVAVVHPSPVDSMFYQKVRGVSKAENAI